jgi:very-short-patch-repair endonuclease
MHQESSNFEHRRRSHQSTHKHPANDHIDLSAEWKSSLKDKAKSSLIEDVLHDRRLSEGDKFRTLINFADAHFNGAGQNRSGNSIEISIQLVHRLAKCFKNLRFDPDAAALMSGESLKLLESHIFQPYIRQLAPRINSNSPEVGLSPKEISNVLWSFAIFGFRPEEIMQPMVAKFGRNLSAFTPEGLSTTLWSLSKLRYLQPEVIAQVGEEIARTRKPFMPIDIASVLSTFAEWNSSSPKVLNALVDMANSKIRRCEPRHLANICKGFASLNFKRDDLLGFVSREFQESGKINRANAEDLATISWAMGKLRYRDEKLFERIASRSLEIINSFANKNIASLLLGYGLSHIENKKLFEGAISKLSEPNRIITSQALAQSAWAVGILYPDLVTRVVTPEILNQLDNDAEWMQVYSALVGCGIVPTDMRFERYDSIALKLNPKAQTPFEISVFEDLKKLQSQNGMEIKPQSFIGGVEVDFELTVGFRKIAIECDGARFHRTTGPNGGGLQGKDILQNRVLSFFGYSVIHIRSAEYFGKHRDRVMEEVFAKIER